MRANVAETHLVETLYMTSWHGSPPTVILSWISRSFEPKLLPSMVSRVPPSSGPAFGWIWRVSGRGESDCLRVSQDD